MGKEIIGLIVDDSTIEKWETKQLVQEIESRDTQADIQNIYRNPLPVAKKDYDFKVALSRTKSSTPFRIEALKKLELSNVNLVNNYESVRLGGDKYTSLSLFLKASLMIPKTYMVASFESAVRAIREVGTPVVIKPVVGTYGDSIERIKKLEGEQLDILDKINYPCLVQEYIGGQDNNFRVFVVGNKALGAVKRIPPKGEWRANISQGARSDKSRLTDKMAKIAVKAQRAVGTKYAGVDLIRRKNQYIVLEVNAQPDFRGFYSKTGVNPASQIIDLLY